MGSEDWVSISLPRELVNDILRYMDRDSSYRSVSEFVRESVRFHLVELDRRRGYIGPGERDCGV